MRDPLLTSQYTRRWFRMPDSSPTTDSSLPSNQLLRESLRLLVLAHYVLALVTALMAPAGIYLAWAGWSMLHPARGDAWTPKPGQEIFDPLVWGATFYLVGGVLAGLSIIHSLLLVHIGRSIAHRKRRRLCLAFSFFDLTYIPLGTTLSVFTLLLLLNPQVRDEFNSIHKSQSVNKNARGN